MGQLAGVDILGMGIRVTEQTAAAVLAKAAANSTQTFQSV